MMDTKSRNLEKEKLEIIKWVTNLKDDSAMERLRKLKAGSPKNDWWDEVTAEEQAAIDKGIEDAKAGRVTEHRAARKLYEKWL
jgi:predicted transcriptional regulator